jgi:hypothetical protein
MTNAQSRAIERIRQEAQSTLFYGDGYEFKRWNVTENEHFAAVVLEVGMIGDEGTLAEAVCRDRAQLFVGKKGDITYPYNYYTNSGEMKFTERRYKGLMKAVLDYKGGGRR